MTDVHQCPYCELRFISRNELQDHIAADHPQPADDDTLSGDPAR
ncbi:MAG TPA: C2H2-type zinc finger protein [Acidimicrobiales bacterium]